MADDPASVADALDRIAFARRQQFGDDDWQSIQIATAARLLRDHADTTNRLAAALERAERSDAKVRELVESEVAAEARLSTLTAAIGTAAWLEWWTGALADIPETLKIRLARIAAAVQPPDSDTEDEFDPYHTEPWIGPDSTPPPACPECGMPVGGWKGMHVQKPCANKWHTPPPTAHNADGTESMSGIPYCTYCTEDAPCSAIRAATPPPTDEDYDARLGDGDRDDPPLSVCPNCTLWRKRSTEWDPTHCPDPWHQR